MATTRSGILLPDEGQAGEVRLRRNVKPTSEPVLQWRSRRVRQIKSKLEHISTAGQRNRQTPQLVARTQTRVEADAPRVDLIGASDFAVGNGDL
jgi:hypothetical protein